MCFFFFKQKTAYEMRISDWSSDVCSSDLGGGKLCARAIRTPSPLVGEGRGGECLHIIATRTGSHQQRDRLQRIAPLAHRPDDRSLPIAQGAELGEAGLRRLRRNAGEQAAGGLRIEQQGRSEEPTSELQS